MRIQKSVLRPVLSMSVISGLTLLISACGGGGSSSTGSTTDGTFNLAITDAPMDTADQVMIEFTGVEFKPIGGASTTVMFATPQRINLMDYRNGLSTSMLSAYRLPAGNYQWLRLMINAKPGVRDSYIMVGGTEYELDMPSGAETGLIVNRTFNMSGGGNMSFTVDFDLRSSVYAPSGMGTSYQLRPTLRMVDDSTRGTMMGSIDTSMVASACSGGDTAAVYVFDAGVAAADDVDGIDPEPITTAMVPMDGQYNYTVGFLEPGNYRVAFTCKAALDQPDTDDAGVTFIGEGMVTVTTRATATHNFMMR